MRIGAIIQARTSSTRLPRKVLKPLPYNSDICVLQQVIRRVSQSRLIDDVIVATTDNDEDSEIVDVAIKEDVKYYRGSLKNVLERYYMAASENNLDVIVRITSDCPCIDFEIIDEVVESHLEGNYDYSSNSLIEHLPRGMDVEVINWDVLKNAYEKACEKYEKEHVTPYIYKSHPEMFKINKCTNSDKDYSDIRITLDTAQDYALLSLVYEELYNEDSYFTLHDILDLFTRKPYLIDINSEIIQKKVCSNLDEELLEAINLCELQDLNKASEFIRKMVK